jgi:acetone carboxylase gamma subunit
MFLLQLSKSKYIRVRKGVNANEIQENFNLPVSNVYEGQIIKLPKIDYKIYLCVPNDTYEKISKKLCVDCERLIEVNGNKPLYPFCKIYY